MIIGVSGAVSFLLTGISLESGKWKTKSIIDNSSKISSFRSVS